MTADDADKVLATLAAAFPNMEMTGATVFTWYDHLDGLTVEAGAEAARRIIAGDKWFPTVARFREVALAAGRDLAARAARERGLPEPPVTPEAAQRNLAHVRALRDQFNGGGA